MLADTTQSFGFMDKNFDGILTMAELPDRWKKRLANSFKLADANGDGGLSIKEMYRLQQMRQRQRQSAAGSAGAG